MDIREQIRKDAIRRREEIRLYEEIRDLQSESMRCSKCLNYEICKIWNKPTWDNSLSRNCPKFTILRNRTKCKLTIQNRFEHTSYELDELPDLNNILRKDGSLKMDMPDGGSKIYGAEILRKSIINTSFL